MRGGIPYGWNDLGKRGSSALEYNGAESCDALQEWENHRCEKAGQSLANPRWYAEAGGSAAQDGRFPQDGARAEAAPAHRRVQLLPCIVGIRVIKFNDKINALDEAQLKAIEQYVHE